MTVDILNHKIPCKLEKSSGKSISLRFSTETPCLLIRTPSGTMTDQARAFIEKKGKWILRNFQKLNSQFNQKEIFLKDLENDRVLFRGNPVSVVYAEGNKRWVKMRDEKIDITITPKDRQVPKKLIAGAALKVLAQQQLHLRTLELARATGVSCNKITIKDVRSKWGSCSGNKNINLNWYLILLPQPLIDYVIIHELMHLRELNHSDRFWALVEKYCPQYKSREEQLQSMSWVIGIFNE
ncbi:MAG: SprT family zinc-dependent metalloprotease [Bacteroidia bacterium]